MAEDQHQQMGSLWMRRRTRKAACDRTHVAKEAAGRRKEATSAAHKSAEARADGRRKMNELWEQFEGRPWEMEKYSEWWLDQGEAAAIHVERRFAQDEIGTVTIIDIAQAIEQHTEFDSQKSKKS